MGNLLRLMNLPRDRLRWVRWTGRRRASPTCSCPLVSSTNQANCALALLRACVHPEIDLRQVTNHGKAVSAWCNKLMACVMAEWTVTFRLQGGYNCIARSCSVCGESPLQDCRALAIWILSNYKKGMRTFKILVSVCASGGQTLLCRTQRTAKNMRHNTLRRWITSAALHN